jgi:hypothetical protein
VLCLIAALPLLCLPVLDICAVEWHHVLRILKGATSAPHFNHLAWLCPVEVVLPSQASCEIQTLEKPQAASRLETRAMAHACVDSHLFY